MIGYTRQDLTLIHIVRVSGFLMTKSFLHYRCTVEEKGRVRKGFLTILTFVTFKMVKVIYIWYPYDFHIPLNMGGSVAHWQWTYGHIQIVLTSMQNVDNGIPVQSQLNCREYVVLRTTGNIGTSPSSSISRDVWAKLIMFIGTLFGASFIIFRVEGKGKNIGV